MTKTLKIASIVALAVIWVLCATLPDYTLFYF